MGRAYGGAWPRRMRQDAARPRRTCRRSWGRTAATAAGRRESGGRARPLARPGPSNPGNSGTGTGPARVRQAGARRTRTAAGKTRPKQAARREQGRVACARGVAAAGLFCRSSHGGLSPAHVVRCNVCHRTASRSPRGPCFLMNSLSVCVKSLSLFSLSLAPFPEFLAQAQAASGYCGARAPVCSVFTNPLAVPCVSLFYVNDIGSTGSRGCTVGIPCVYPWP